MTGRSARDVVGPDGPIRVDEDGTLWVEGRAAPELAAEYGTPLYVTSEAQIRANVRRLRQALDRLRSRARALRHEVERQPRDPARARRRGRGR